jgi:hypothetical protein
MFMCLMNNILSKYLDNFVLVFIDDILIYSKTKEEHEEHLILVLQVLREHQLYAKYNKCDFFQGKNPIFGSCNLKRWSGSRPKKIKEIMDWPAPRNVSEVRSFMGLDGYYQRFIQGF